METILVKIFATALALSQVTTAPDAVKTQFDRVADQQEVGRLLRAGCAHMRKAFDIEDINLDELITTAMDDPQAMAGEIKAFRGINFADLHIAYRQFCKGEAVEKPAVDLGDVIDFYNKAAANLPDHTRLKGLKLPGASVVLDGKGQRFAEVFEENQRRVWISIADVPEHVQKAFIAAEDKRFFQHKGIDERGLIRAFIGNLAQSGRPQGGSTITQQVVKNLLVGEDLTYERKIREMIVATRLERTLSKAEILELYLNSTYLGRSAWGIEMAARSYFGKPAKELALPEGALLAGLTKGPNYYNPDRHPERARERLGYVLTRLQEEGTITAEQSAKALNPMPELIAYERPHRDFGFHFVDQVAREAKTLAGIEGITANSYTVRSTINVPLQKAVEAALQEGLWRYERSAGRSRFVGPEANLAKAMAKIDADPKKSVDKRPTWQRALVNARLPLYDVHWTPAIVVEKPSGRKGEAWRVGLADGRIVPLSADGSILAKLKLSDVVFVRVTDANAKSKVAVRAEIRVRPSVQGTAVVLENKTGRILAMAGGFSYPLSQLNRATQAQRQPGSAIKPLSYLAALRRLQPNTYVSDDPITLPPIGGTGRAREQDYWTPRNYDGGYGGTLTLRRALENSRNLATVHLLDGGIDDTPEASLERLCALAMEAQIYRECVKYYPFVLGAQPVRPVDLAAFYAAIANEGIRPSPYVVESIERNGLMVYRHDTKSSMTAIGSADRVAFYQLKTMMQGVLSRGTARSIASLSPYVAGKTGTSDESNDAWFVGFTNDVTIAIWLGYDNAAGKRRTLGGNATGGHVAVPIFEPIIQAVWTNHSTKTALAPPSPEAKRQMACRAVDAESGTQLRTREARGLTECFRIDRTGQIIDTQYQLVSRDGIYGYGESYSPNPNPFGFLFGNQRPYYEPRRDNYYYYDNYGRPVPPREVVRPPAQYYYGQNRRSQPQTREYYYNGRESQTPQRVDPNYYRGGGFWRW